jgi:hypothetical protein
MISPLNITQKCPYVDCCNYADSTECIDKYYRYLNQEDAENPSKSRQFFRQLIMKKYSKPEILAKNLPSGSYAAGCPAKGRGFACLIFYPSQGCRNCERSK